jgi:hypothetical protein
MEATYSYETTVDFQRPTRRYIPEDRTLDDHRCENLKSYTKNNEMKSSPPAPKRPHVTLNTYSIAQKDYDITSGLIVCSRRGWTTDCFGFVDEGCRLRLAVQTGCE